MDVQLSLIVVAVSGAVELVLCRFIHKPWMRFIPSIILLILSVSIFLYGRFAPLESLKDLAYMVTGVFIFFSFLSSAAVAIIFNLLTRNSDMSI